MLESVHVCSHDTRWQHIWVSVPNMVHARTPYKVTELTGISYLPTLSSPSLYIFVLLYYTITLYLLHSTITLYCKISMCVEKYEINKNNYEETNIAYLRLWWRLKAYTHMPIFDIYVTLPAAVYEQLRPLPNNVGVTPNIHFTSKTVSVGEKFHFLSRYIYICCLLVRLSKSWLLQLICNKTIFLTIF